MTRIRVLHCLQQVGSGGVEQRRLLLARGLDPTCYEQHLLCTGAVGGLPEQFSELGCLISEIGEFKSVFDFERFSKALRVVQEFRPDIIHGAVFEGVAVAAVAGTLGKVPVIIGEETSDPKNRSWKGDLLYRFYSAFTHHMVAVSPATESYLCNRIKIPSRKVSTIWNGVSEKSSPDPALVESIRSFHGIKIDDFVIGVVCRLVDHHKRVSDLIHAVSQLKGQNPRVKLLVVGDGPDMLALQEMAVKKGVLENVVFCGYQSDTRPYYEIMDAFVLASAYEAFGLVLVEAMYAGLPVIATRVGGIPMVVEEGSTALLVDSGSPNQISQAVLRLIREPALRSNLGQAGLKRARECFSEKRYVSDVDALYQRLLPERGLI